MGLEGFDVSRPAAAAAAAAAAAGLGLALTAEELVRSQFVEIRLQVEKEVNMRCRLEPPVSKKGSLLESAALGASRWLAGFDSCNSTGNGDLSSSVDGDGAAVAGNESDIDGGRSGGGAIVENTSSAELAPVSVHTDEEISDIPAVPSDETAVEVPAAAEEETAADVPEEACEAELAVEEEAGSDVLEEACEETVATASDVAGDAIAAETRARDVFTAAAPQDNIISEPADGDDGT